MNYLDGIVRRSHRVRVLAVGLVLWVAIVVAFWAITSRMDASLPVLVAVLVVIVLAAIALRTLNARTRKTTLSLRKAELLRLRERFDEAVPLFKEVLSSPLSAQGRAQALLALGQCAEARGDLAAAVLVYQQADMSIVTTPAMVRGQLRPVVSSRLAFVLAACGRLEEASAALGRAAHRDAHPQAYALIERAAILLASRSGCSQEVVDRIVRSWSVLRTNTTWRDRTLFHVLMAMARGLPVHGPRDEALRAWVLAVEPAVRFS